MTTDRYPGTTIPEDWLVPPERQPEYLDLPPGVAGSATNVGEALTSAQVALGRGNDVAIIEAETGKQHTFLDLERETGRLANALRRAGVVPGDRVAFRSPNRVEPLIVAIAAWRMGAVVVPTPVLARARELQHLFSDTTPRMLFTHVPDGGDPDLHQTLEETDIEQVVAFGSGAASAESLQDLESFVAGCASHVDAPELRGDAVAIVWHTGGTTGLPKGCYHTHRRFLLGGWSVGHATGAARGERWAASAPVGHALGFIYHTIYSLLHGATAVLIEEFSDPARVLHAIGRFRVDTFTAISASWGKMLAELQDGSENYDVSSLRRAHAMWQSASSTDVAAGWRERGLELLNNFGSTAFATWVLVPQDDSCPPAWLGRAGPGYEVMAIDPDAEGLVPVAAGKVGRMAVRGPTGLTYWNRPEQQERDVRDGWTLADDLIRFDEHGNAEYLGRTDYMISTVGHKIAPAEVENVLSQHGSVREVVVLGTPDPERQQVVTAFVALADGSTPSPGLVTELQEFVKSRLAPYKYPRRVEFVDALPRDDVGKIKPRELLETWEADGGEVTV